MDEKDTKTVEVDNTTLPSKTEKADNIQVAPTPDYSAPKAKTEQLEDARGWESENLIQDLEKELEQANYKLGFFDMEFKNPKHFTWMIVAFASMGGLLSGLDQSLISGANLTLPKDLGLTASQNSLVNSGMPLGAVAGAFLISPCNEYFGRRWAIIISCILYTIGGALEAGAMNYGMMVAARVVLGAGVGLEGGTVPVYVAETVESRLRGNLVSLYQFNIALGEVLGYAVAAMFITLDDSWRYILGSSLVFSTIMGIGILFMPESPRYLMHKNKPLEAFKVWKRIRGTATHEAREEFFVMKVSTEMEEAEVAAGRTNRFPWMDFFTKPRARRAIIYANIMIFLGQFTGINAIMYYMSVLMSQVGFDTYDATYMSLVGGGSLLIGTIPAIFLMETCGRRFWAIAMLPGFFIGLLLVGISYHLTTLSATLGLYLSGLILYMLFFGSYAALTWVVPSEVYPTYLRSYGMTTSTGWLFLSSFIVTYNFTGMQNAFTRTGLTLGFYGGIAVLGWFYQIFFMPETKDLTLEEIDQLFQKPTRQLVKENAKNSWEVTTDLCHGRFKKVFIDNNRRLRREE
ncbi:AraJ Arabinose efflux permease [Pyrenophora tritici-repentis]|uniref:Plastidic glucose transporter n=2 Tax=Pyrenophora tritici-repentis TaxID=45151 RepID=A0A2W1FYM6_9PLEO|nr:plastidic glucose transporter 4 [Pyrenophora tritici-repentis Pt-1C-BFP]KAA8619300.1 Plastidic glucose transporter 4 [Pyrenophora tritici-repentis]EDU49089.1 plastidic glucose transporter 4 [Pyrenophora tritici-repentis Pt-1C-BFP]KAF7449772.1 Plastidic glucose transporter 4 [Pyrenophora tritici-repentis]KAF7570101.1 ProP, Permease major facilitator superfamily [Pyrenophora tritici-repentis]KAG9383299.1 Plastidic glucose transporter 4 [Pyrenophora tritici-repentis]